MKTTIPQSTRKMQLRRYPRSVLRATFINGEFPEIYLCGEWLQDIGFDYGQRIAVLYKKGRIVIKAVKHSENHTG